VILCGGGAKNSFLRARIQAALGNTEVSGSGELGWPPEAIEGAAFALLAWLRWHEKPGNIPSTTGARRACLLGQVARP
jgi:anhydro-N-acetylmuramic acid kinase